MTNNQDEYSALNAGLEAALDRGISKILVLGDSDLITSSGGFQTDACRKSSVQAKAAE